MVPETDPILQLGLPPGFRFYPTDEELMVQYLCRKVAGHNFSLPIIGEIDLYKFNPWVLPGKAKFGEKEWYFFSPRDRKYPNGSRPNRVAGSGYWKATGTDKIITTQGRRVGIKKALVFYAGKAPKGTKTNWIMHEYRLYQAPSKNGSAKLDDWVLCRIYKKHSSCHSGEISSKEHSHGSPSSSSSQFDDLLESPPEINNGVFNLPRMNSPKNLHHDDKVNIQNLTSGDFDWASLAGITSLPDLVPGNQDQRYISNNTHDDNDLYVPSITPLCHDDSFCDKFGTANEEVQSAIRTHRFENSGFSRTITDSHDPFRIRYPYPAQSGGGFEFRQ